MKKYFLTMATVALFAVGFAASDEEESSSNESSATQTEQKQETEAERQAREKKEEAERKAREEKEKKEQQDKKKKEIEEKAYKAGYKEGFTVGPNSYTTDDPKRQGRIYYTTVYGAPTSNEEKELCDLFVKKYVEGYEDGHAAQ